MGREIKFSVQSPDEIAEYATFQYFLFYTNNKDADFKNTDLLVESIAERIVKYKESELSSLTEKHDKLKEEYEKLQSIYLKTQETGWDE